MSHVMDDRRRPPLTPLAFASLEEGNKGSSAGPALVAVLLWLPSPVSEEMVVIVRVVVFVVLCELIKGVACGFEEEVEEPQRPLRLFAITRARSILRSTSERLFWKLLLDLDPVEDGVWL